EHSHIASDRRVFLSADKSSPSVETHADVDGCALLFHAEVVAADRDFVHGAGLFAFVSNDFGKLGDIDGRSGGVGRKRGNGSYVADEIEAGFHATSEVGRFAHGMDVHVVDMGIVPEEMIVQSGDVNAVIEEGGKDGVDLILEKNEVAHHDIGAV